MSESRTALACKNLWKVFGDGTLELLHRHLSSAGNATPEDHHTQCVALADSIRDIRGIVACADIELAIRQGEFFVLMGLSGSGKSTLMRCLSRLTEPDAGELLLDNQSFLSVGPRELREIRRHKMGMVFQHFGLFPHMNVRDNVAYPLRVQGIPSKERYRKADEMIELVGLAGRELARPHQLSGGQKQRVGIARSLAVDPSLWFLDEPFSALDPLIRWQMQTELLRLQSKFHKTIVFVTHDFMEAVRLADRVAIMRDGFVEQLGTPSEILLNPASEYVAEFVREAPRMRIITLGQLLKDESIQPSGNPPATTDVVNALPADTTLEEALASNAGRIGDLAVRDDNGQLLGSISAGKLRQVLNPDSPA